eukprot:gnl/TRDRNA2_/TRDRNA2_175903_c0_seq1.p1 gnl/TRDRNA2_/TRDRNA2_175903_c0~~gnl/TRDRNA2_/TRDRNA2_175903_c0_seq1.p1  ORF type:complete len:417 (-),score=35.59 gnl/TRDRNA2_/TRDRNA2_175903_c0_seq1:264-1514(-)
MAQVLPAPFVQAAVRSYLHQLNEQQYAELSKMLHRLPTASLPGDASQHPQVPSLEVHPRRTAPAKRFEDEHEIPHLAVHPRRTSQVKSWEDDCVVPHLAVHPRRRSQVSNGSILSTIPSAVATTESAKQAVMQPFRRNNGPELSHFSPHPRRTTNKAVDNPQDMRNMFANYEAGSTGGTSDIPTDWVALLDTSFTSNDAALGRECGMSCSSSDVSDDSGSDTEVLVGPCDVAVQPCTFEKLWLSDSTGQTHRIKSRSGVLYLSDTLRLVADTPSGRRHVSFGSALHMCDGAGIRCRPCMFERGRHSCRRGRLCDFCHLHSQRKQPERATPAERATPERHGVQKPAPLLPRQSKQISPTSKISGHSQKPAPSLPRQSKQMSPTPETMPYENTAHRRQQVAASSQDDSVSVGYIFGLS